MVTKVPLLWLQHLNHNLELLAWVSLRLVNHICGAVCMKKGPGDAYVEMARLRLGLIGLSGILRKTFTSSLLGKVRARRKFPLHSS
jgi:hypothetical protein